MAAIAGWSPFKTQREVVEGHLGLSHFSGNINTYWGSILEDLVTIILEQRWHCKIYETGSLPGAVPHQKYSPDGLVYLPFLDMNILIEIKSAARRVANGTVPKMYKPQIHTGLNSIPVVDKALFVDAMFRRCSMDDMAFNTKYDHEMHGKKPVPEPMALGLVCLYEEMYSSDYDTVKTRLDVKTHDWIDAGACSLADLTDLLKDAADGKLKYFFPNIHSDETKTAEGVVVMIEEFTTMVHAKQVEPIAVMPIKLFRLDIIPVECDDWKRVYDRKLRAWVMPDDAPDGTFVEAHHKTINTVIAQIKELEVLSPDQQEERLDELYPQAPKYTKENYDDIMASMFVGDNK
jgi:hypothetical protein